MDKQKLLAKLNDTVSSLTDIARELVTEANFRNVLVLSDAYGLIDARAALRSLIDKLESTE